MADKDAGQMKDGKGERGLYGQVYTDAVQKLMEDFRKRNIKGGLVGPGGGGMGPGAGGGPGGPGGGH